MCVNGINYIVNACTSTHRRHLDLKSGGGAPLDLHWCRCQLVYGVRSTPKLVGSGGMPPQDNFEIYYP